MMSIEPDISLFIENQFPAIYQETGPIFIKFVEAYYEFLESSGNPLFYIRRTLDNDDIDLTIDQFIIHFKEKYLKNIKLDTTVDIRLLVKHALDLYRLV